MRRTSSSTESLHLTIGPDGSYNVIDHQFRQSGEFPSGLMRPMQPDAVVDSIRAMSTRAPTNELLAGQFLTQYEQMAVQQQEMLDQQQQMLDQQWANMSQNMALIEESVDQQLRFLGQFGVFDQ